MKKLFITALLSVLWMGSAPPVSAQWLSQTNTLVPGWNAVYLHVDPSHATLEDLIAADVNNPILEVWLWAPAPATMQYITTPQEPIDTGSQWASWNRSSSSSSLLQRLVGNAAYLVHVGTNVSSYQWVLKGKPVAPAYRWTTTGLNFLGFPTVPANPPSFDTFLVQAPELYQNAQVYQYVGGELEAGNPAQVYAMRTTRVNRGQAYWVRAGEVFNRYYAPFETSLAGASGVDYGTSLSAYSLRLRNLSSSSITVTLRLIASETPPAGQTNIAGVPPLLVRGNLNSTNLTYSFTNLTAASPRTWTLAASGTSGSEVEVVLGLNRYVISDPPGTLLAGILRFSDSLGFSQVDVPVAATAASRAGLWVGSAAVTQVGQYLKTYQRDAAGTLLTDTNGAYLVSGVNTNLGDVPRSFPLRLLVHNPDSGNAVLLQRVYFGLDAATNPVVARSESALHRAFLKQARRFSASHLPWTSDNTPWPFNGRLGQTTTLIATNVTTSFDDQASNPFLHTYHPDHDNLNATFNNTLPQGAESYTIRREITLQVTPPADDFTSLTTSGQAMTGDYCETISLLGLARAGGANDTRQFQIRGVFKLNQIAGVPTLAQ